MISLIVVNYRAARLAADCIDSARRFTRAALEVIVIDNSVDPAEAERLRPHADRIAVPSSNEGYAAAINAGRKLARGDVLIASNPDVLFGAGAIDILASSLDGRTAVAGPALFWDDDRRWLLPPADLTTTGEKLGEVIASRSHLWSAWRDRRRIRRRLRFWQTIEATPVRAVSGAVMAIRSKDFDRVGGFDERFRLYFEEVDFMRRIRRAGGGVMYVPSASCRHLYNQSAGEDNHNAAALYAESERAYLEKWSSRPLARALKRLERPRVPGTFRELEDEEPIEIDLEDSLVEASPLSSFETAAGHFPPRGRLELPAEILNTYRGEALYLRVIDCATASVRAAYVRRDKIRG